MVLHASVTLAWFLDDPVPLIAQKVRRFLESGGRATVPQLWHLEVANGFLTAERRGILTGGGAKAAIMNLNQLLSSSIDTASGFTPLGQIHDFAQPLYLSAYDAVYLNFARIQNRPLATLDKSLIRAAKSTGVEVFS